MNYQPFACGQTDAQLDELCKFPDLAGKPGFAKLRIALMVTEDFPSGTWVKLVGAPEERRSVFLPRKVARCEGEASFHRFDPVAKRHFKPRIFVVPVWLLKDRRAELLGERAEAKAS